MSLPGFLVPETIIHETGVGPALDLDGRSGQILLTLGILEVIEQESLLVSIHSSPDGTDWTAASLIEFPQKFYTGVSAVLIDTAVSPTRFLRAQWKADRWGRGPKTPTFRIYLFAELIDD